MIPRTDQHSLTGGRIRKGGYSPRSINDVYLSGYAKVRTPGASAPYFWVPQVTP